MHKLEMRHGHHACQTRDYKGSVPVEKATAEEDYSFVMWHALEHVLACSVVSHFWYRRNPISDWVCMLESLWSHPANFQMVSASNDLYHY